MAKPRKTTTVRVTFTDAAGARPVRVALVGLPNSGKSTPFQAVASTAVQTGELAGSQREYRECAVQIGARQVRLVDWWTCRASPRCTASRPTSA